MAAPGFVWWVLNGIPKVVQFISKEVRKREVKNIDNAVDIGNDVYINNKLRDVKKKYEGDVRASS